MGHHVCTTARFYSSSFRRIFPVRLDNSRMPVQTSCRRNCQAVRSSVRSPGLASRGRYARCGCLRRPSVSARARGRSMFNIVRRLDRCKSAMTARPPPDIRYTYVPDDAVPRPDRFRPTDNWNIACKLRLPNTPLRSLPTHRPKVTGRPADSAFVVICRVPSGIIIILSASE